MRRAGPWVEFRLATLLKARSRHLVIYSNRPELVRIALADPVSQAALEQELLEKSFGNEKRCAFPQPALDIPAAKEKGRGHSVPDTAPRHAAHTEPPRHS